MSVPRLSRCPYRLLGSTLLVFTATLRPLTETDVNSTVSGSFLRIITRRLDLSERLCSSFQQDVSLDGNVLRDLRLEASTHYIFRGDKANRCYCECRASGYRCSKRICNRIHCYDREQEE